MRRDLLRRILLGAALPVAIGALMAGTAGPALAWNAHVHTYSFIVANNTGGNVNDAKFSIMGQSPPGLPVLPTFLRSGSTTFWPINTQALFLWRVVNFGPPPPGFAVPNGAARWFCVTVNVPSLNPSTVTQAWFQWSLNGVLVGPATALGFQIHSPAAMFNSSTDPTGAANTHNMVVRNLQFAKSPYQISTDSLAADNPTVLARFGESPDPVRAGPFTVAPGDTQAVSPPIDSSIPQPTFGGSTVLGRGTVEDFNGVQQTFVVQFANPLPVPGASRVGLMVLALLLATIGVLVLWRSRALTHAGTP